MTLEKNRAVVMRSVVEVVGAGDEAAILEIFSPNYVAHYPGGAPDSSRDDVIAQVRELRAAFPDLRAEAVHLVAEGDLVAIHTRMRGTDASNSKSFDVMSISIDRVVGGQIVESWIMVDEVGMQQQLSDG